MRFAKSPQLNKFSQVIPFGFALSNATTVHSSTRGLGVLPDPYTPTNSIAILSHTSVSPLIPSTPSWIPIQPHHHHPGRNICPPHNLALKHIALVKFVGLPHYCSMSCWNARYWRCWCPTVIIIIPKPNGIENGKKESSTSLCPSQETSYMVTSSLCVQMSSSTKYLDFYVLSSFRIHWYKANEEPVATHFFYCKFQVYHAYEKWKLWKHVLCISFFLSFEFHSFGLLNACKSNANNKFSPTYVIGQSAVLIITRQEPRQQ